MLQPWLIRLVEDLIDLSLRDECLDFARFIRHLSRTSRPRENKPMCAAESTFVDTLCVTNIKLSGKLHHQLCDQAGSFNVAMSITKRYFTSLLSMRSYASFTSCIGMISISAVIPWTPQKSSIS